MRSDGVIRHKIWEEDDYFQMGDKRIDMDPSVVTLPAGCYMVWNYNWDSKPIGRCFDIRVEDDVITCGVVWMDLTLNDDTPKDLGVRLGGQYYEVVKNDDGTRVTHCVLKGVGLFVRPDSIDIPREEVGNGSS
jgi:hypothetical protein